MALTKIVSEEEWVEASKALLKKEKEFTILRDQLSHQRHDQSWVDSTPWDIDPWPNAFAGKIKSSEIK